ncbi:hypothetical protein FB451DRAFT_1340594 [Mycena latifolia]|nr:hypothetical protein FB451DRAFT_1340594 [Mycena latifolia]
MRYTTLLLLVRYALASPLFTEFKMHIHAAKFEETHSHPELWSPEFWGKIGISMMLVILGGVFAGLTLGLMGLDELHLRVLATSSEDPREQSSAQKVLALMQKGRHWVLVVLLLSNVIINDSLPIFLDSAAFPDATDLILARRIIPQALSVCYGLAIGALCAPFVLALMYLLLPIAYPIALLLDLLLGADHGHTYKKAELRSFLALHRTGEEPLRDDEISILNGVLELGGKSVEGIMTPMQDVVTLSADAILDEKLVEAILLSGYSRFPVHKPHDPDAFVGLLLIKKLVKYDPARALPVSSFPLLILPEARPSINCFHALDYFQTGRAHLLLISRTPGNAGGAIGEILSEEIVDETDLYEDNVGKQRAQRVTSAAVMRGIVERRGRDSSFSSSSSDDERTHLLSRSPSGSTLARSVYGSVQ